MKEQVVAVIGEYQSGKSTLCSQLLAEFQTCNGFRKLKEKITFQEYHTKLAQKLKLIDPHPFLMHHTPYELASHITRDVYWDAFISAGRKFVIIDTPGSAQYLDNFVVGVSFAQAALVIISAQEGQFEAQEQVLRDQITIAYTLGVKQLICCVNRMDQANYQKWRYEEIQQKLAKFLLQVGFRPERTHFIPISALYKENLFKPSENLPWAASPLVPLMEKFAETLTHLEKPLRISVFSTHNRPDEKMVVVGKVECGTAKEGQILSFLEPGFTVCDEVQTFNEKIELGVPNQLVGLLVAKSQAIKRGVVISQEDNRPAKACLQFKGLIMVLACAAGLRKNRSYHVYNSTQQVQCRVVQIQSKIHRHTDQVLEAEPESLKNGESGIVILRPKQKFVAEKFTEISSLGRFVLLANRKLIGVGIVKDVQFE